jgi:hypothetical protein
MFKIIVGTQLEKEQLLEASKLIHDCRYLDSSNQMLDTLMHLYLAPELIQVIYQHPE